MMPSPANRTNSWFRTTTAPVVNRNSLKRACAPIVAIRLETCRAPAPWPVILTWSTCAASPTLSSSAVFTWSSPEFAPTWLSTSIARAPLSITTSERTKTEAGSLPAFTKMRWIGRASATPSATWITAPSPMNAVLSATATSSVGTSLPRWATRCGSPPASRCAIEPMVRPVSRSARSESSGTKAPSTKTIARASIAASMSIACLARVFAAASGTRASGLASRMSARRSVYFHSSTRRCGSPSLSKRWNASSRNAATPAAHGSARFAMAKFVASAVSAAVLIGRTSTFIATSRRLVPVLGVAGGFELERQRLVAGLHDAALRKDVHHVRHDVVEQALVVRDDDEGAVGGAQPVDALGDHLEGIDVEAGIGLVEHAQPRLQQRHLQDLVALLLAAGKADIDAAAEHILVDAELARDLVHAFHELGHQQFGLAARLALRVERRAQEGHGGNAGNFERILEREKKSLGGALVGREGENVLAVEQHLALGDDVIGLAGEHMREGRLARAVGAHDGVDAALADRKLEPIEDLLAVDLDVQVFYFQQMHSNDFLTLNPRPETPLKADVEGYRVRCSPASFETAASRPPQDACYTVSPRCPPS